MSTCAWVSPFQWDTMLGLQSKKTNKTSENMSSLKDNQEKNKAFHCHNKSK